MPRDYSAAVEVPYFLSKYDPDPLRLYLTATAPETGDTEACPACPEQSRGEELEGQAMSDAQRTATHSLRSPVPLFKKLDQSVIEEEYGRLEGQQSAEQKGAGACDQALSDPPVGRLRG